MLIATRPRRIFRGHSSLLVFLRDGCNFMRQLLHYCCILATKEWILRVWFVCKSLTVNWSQWSGLNRRPTVYETVAIPLSYIGLTASQKLTHETTLANIGALAPAILILVDPSPLGKDVSSAIER